MAIPHAFTVIYEPAEEGGFYAHIPALDVTTEGETLEDAKLMARDAIENVLACRRQLNLPIPPKRVARRSRWEHERPVTGPAAR